MFVRALNVTFLGQREGELSSALNLDDAHPVELLHVGRRGAAFTPTPTKLT